MRSSGHRLAPAGGGNVVKLILLLSAKGLFFLLANVVFSCVTETEKLFHSKIFFLCFDFVCVDTMELIEK